MKPNIILLGVGHSGTTIATRALEALGWESNAEGDQWAESPAMRAINERLIAGDSSTLTELQAFRFRLRGPWVFKDPRLVLTLDQWYWLNPGLLVWLTRDIEETKQSYRRRGELVDGEPGMYGRSVDQLHAAAQDQFDRWLGAKLTLSHDQIRAACSLYT